MKTLSERALFLRIKRRVARDGETLRTSRKWTTDTRNYYVVKDGFIVAACDSLDSWARELGVLRAGEEAA